MKQIQQNFYLYTQAQIIKAEKTWEEFDCNKGMDFSEKLFWVTDYIDGDCRGFNTENEAINYAERCTKSWTEYCRQEEADYI